MIPPVPFELSQIERCRYRIQLSSTARVHRSGSMGRNGGDGSGQCSGFGSQPGEENLSSMKGFNKNKNKNGSGTAEVQD